MHVNGFVCCFSSFFRPGFFGGVLFSGATKHCFCCFGLAPGACAPFLGTISRLGFFFPGFRIGPRERAPPETPGPSFPMPKYNGPSAEGPPLKFQAPPGRVGLVGSRCPCGLRRKRPLQVFCGKRKNFFFFWVFPLTKTSEP